MKEYFGIDVGGTAVKWAVLGEDFSIRERGSLPTDFATADEAVEALAGLVEPYRDRVSAVGVSAPGGIYEDDADGTISRGILRLASVGRTVAALGSARIGARSRRGIIRCNLVGTFQSGGHGVLYGARSVARGARGRD